MTETETPLSPVSFLRLLSIEIADHHEVIPPSPWLTLALIENGASKAEIEESRKEQIYAVSTGITGIFAAHRDNKRAAYDLWNKGEIFRFTIPMELAGEAKTFDWRITAIGEHPLLRQVELTCVTVGGPIP